MVFLSIGLVLIAGHYTGFFRIPQVKSFLNIASRKLHDADISRIPEVVAQELQHTLPLLEAIGQSIVDLHKLEAEIDYAEGRRYPTIPSLIRSPRHILPSHPLSLTPPIPGSADESKTFGLAPLSRTPLATVPWSSSSSPSVTAVSPLITELVRFIEVSALPTDSLNGLRPHEREYRLLLEDDPEKFSCFREQNPTYRRILTTLEEQSRTRDPVFLARWMIWRVYAWGLKAVQDRFGALKSGRHGFSAREMISKRDGNDTIKVKTYGAQFGPNVPANVQKINKIWKGSVGYCGVSYRWGDGNNHRERRQRHDERIGNIGVETTSDSGRGGVLEILHRTLNTLLSPAVKALFHGGEAGLFDIEHALCKLARKQRNMRDKVASLAEPDDEKRENSAKEKNSQG
jgi:hypothetical protein